VNFNDYRLDLSADIGTLLEMYGDYVNWPDKSTYLDDFFVHLEMWIINNPELQAVFVQYDHNDGGARIKATFPTNGILDIENLDNILFIYETGHKHYKSTNFSKAMKIEIIEKERNSIIDDLLNNLDHF